MHVGRCASMCMYFSIYVCKCVCMHIFMHTFRYVCRKKYMNLYMYVCMHVYQVYSCVTIHIFDMSLNKYGSHITNMNQIPIMPNWYVYPTFLHKYSKSEPIVISTLCYCHACANNEYSP